MATGDLNECAKCGFANLPNAVFCSGCGQRFDEGAGFRERRWLTVLFCDIVGWTAFTGRVGLETSSNVLDAYHGICSEIASQHGGFSAQLLGDGVMVYFGYPATFEDNASRALRAALDLVNRIPGRPLIDRHPELTLNIRVGVATGWVALIRTSSGVLARGETPIVASRLQDVAKPNTVVISETTFRTTKGWFEYDDLGPRVLEGMAESMRIYLLKGATAARSSSAQAGGVGLTPFVGRDQQVGALFEAWNEVERGRTRTVFLTGEPGIGKSRQVRVLRESLEKRGHVILECSCSPYHQGTALYPVIEMIERNLGLTPEQPPAERLRRLEERLASRNLMEASRHLAPLLSAGDQVRFDPEMTPKKQREAIFDALLSWLRAEAAHAPVLFVAEDLHWADRSTVDFLGEVAKADILGSLTLLTARPPPNFEPPWGDLPRLSSLALNPLDPQESRQMVSRLVRGKLLPAEVLDYIVRRAEGVPLFLEEITRALTESPQWMREESDRFDLLAPLSSVSVTETLNDWLSTRLGRLGSGKQVAQIAAVLGRTFRADILEEVAPDSTRDLGHLIEAGLLFREERHPSPVYRFKHALIQEAAYGSLMPDTRKQHHEKIAQVIATKFEELCRAEPELMARHYTGAGRSGEAAKHWRMAGESAVARSAFLEAIDAFSAALVELAKQPASPDRDRMEIELHASLGLARIQVKGWSVPEVEESFRRARELCQLYGDIPIRIHFGAWAAYVVRGDREMTAGLALEFQKIIETSSDASALLIAHSVLGARAFWSGDYRTADRHLLKGKAYLNRERSKEQAQSLLRDYGYEGPIYPHCFMLWSDLYQGRERESLEGFAETFELARTIANPYVLAMAVGWGAALAHDLGDVEAAASRAQELMTLALDNGLYFWVAVAQSVGGWAMLKRGDIDQGLKSMHDAIANHHAMGSKVLLPYYLSYIAESCLLVADSSADANARIAEGLQAVDEGLEITRTNLATHYIPELHRLKGELLLRKGDRSGAIENLSHAQKLSAAQGAVLFERRATEGLARARGV